MTASVSSPRATWAFTSVAIRRTIRDRGNLFFLLVFPLLLIFLVGLQFGGEATSTRVGVVVPSGATTEVASLRDALADHEAVVVVDHDDVATMEGDVAAGRIAAGVVLPTTLDEPGAVATFVVGGSQGTVVRQVVGAVLTDAAAGMRDLAVVAQATGLDPTAVASARELAATAVTPVGFTSRTLGTTIDEEFAGASQFGVGAASQLLLFVFVTSLAGSAALIQARQWGVTRRALAAPIRPRTILLGEAAGRLAVALVQAGIIVVGTRLLYGVEWGDPLAAGVVILLFCAVGAGFAMLLGSVAKNDAQASGGGVVAGLGLAALGGAMVPIELFPTTLRQVAHITPHAWAGDALAEITRRGGGLGDVLLEVAVLAAFAVVVLSLAAWRLRVAIVRAGS